MGDTSIQWTDRTVNPIRARNKATGAVGHFCEKVSAGCTHCYASTWNERVRPITQKNGDGLLIGTGLSFDVRNRDQIEFFLDDSKLLEVLKRKAPTKWFWCDMTDMFGDWVPFEWIDRCFAVMALTRHHTHQVLTKRADRLFQYMTNRALSANYWKRAVPTGYALEWQGHSLVPFPLPNVWLGVSAEDQQRADERIPLLLQTPAAVRFVSAEPLLGPIRFETKDGGNSLFTCQSKLTNERYEAMTPEQQMQHGDCCEAFAMHGEPHYRGVDWVIIGGESGNGARPMDLAWTRSIVAQCKAAGVACFVKQLGSVPRTSEFASVVIGECGIPQSDRPATVGHRLLLSDRKGGDPSEWPSDLRVRQFPEVCQ